MHIQWCSMHFSSLWCDWSQSALPFELVSESQNNKWKAVENYCICKYCSSSHLLVIAEGSLIGDNGNLADKRRAKHHNITEGKHPQCKSSAFQRISHQKGALAVQLIVNWLLHQEIKWKPCYIHFITLDYFHPQPFDPWPPPCRGGFVSTSLGDEKEKKGFWGWDFQ